MSGTFTPDHPAIFLLPRLLEAAGWESPICIMRERMVRFTTKKSLQRGNEVREVNLEIELWFHIGISAFALYEFNVEEKLIQPPDAKWAEPRVLNPQVFLKFYGKREVNASVVDSFFGRTLGDDLWIIKVGKNLEALFDAYDALAQKVGAIQLFQPLPGKAS